MADQPVQRVPVNYSCPGEIHGNPLPPPPCVKRTCEPSLYIGANEAVEQKAAVTFVDCRDFNRQQQNSLEGSLPMKLSAIKVAKELKGKSLVLITDGPMSYEAEMAVKTLRTEGFTVRSLKGGLAAWKAAGGTLRGEASAGQCSALNVLWARDYPEQVKMVALSPLPQGVAEAIPNVLRADQLDSLSADQQVIFLDGLPPEKFKGAFTVEGGAKALVEALAKLPPGKALVPGNAECGGCM